MVGSKAGSRKMLAKHGALTHDLPPGFEPNLKKAAGKRATMPAKGKSHPNVALAPRSKAASRGISGLKSHATKPKK